jgi:hypothetical protein
MLRQKFQFRPRVVLINVDRARTTSGRTTWTLAEWWAPKVFRTCGATSTFKRLAKDKATGTALRPTDEPPVPVKSEAKGDSSPRSSKTLCRQGKARPHVPPSAAVAVIPPSFRPCPRSRRPPPFASSSQARRPPSRLAALPQSSSTAPLRPPEKSPDRAEVNSRFFVLELPLAPLRPIPGAHRLLPLLSSAILFAEPPLAYSAPLSEIYPTATPSAPICRGSTLAPGRRPPCRAPPLSYRSLGKLLSHGRFARGTSLIDLKFAWTGKGEGVSKLRGGI